MYFISTVVKQIQILVFVLYKITVIYTHVFKCSCHNIHKSSAAETSIIENSEVSFTHYHLHIFLGCYIQIITEEKVDICFFNW